MPCLNEEKTLRKCLVEATNFLKDNNINGEILIADSGSTGNSINIIKESKTMFQKKHRFHYNMVFHWMNLYIIRTIIII